MTQRIARAGLSSVLILGFVLSTPAVAQEQKAARETRAGWHPRTVQLNGLTPAQRATVMARLEAIERILLRIPELANPKGFEIMPIFGSGSRQLGPHGRPIPGSVIGHGIRLAFYAPTKARGGEASGCVGVQVNPGALTGPGLPIRDEQGREIYNEPPRWTGIPLATEVYGELSPVRGYRSSASVLMTSGGEVPWKSVSREQYYNAVVFDAEGKEGEKLAEYRKSLQKTRYEDWMERAAERRAMREEGLRVAAQANGKAEADKMRKTLEDTDRQVTETLKAADAEDRARNKTSLATSFEFRDRARAELAAMSPAERAMPALIDGTLTDAPKATGWPMAARDVPPATWRVLTPDYDFWRARRSPVEARGILVQLSASLGCLRPAIHDAVWQTWLKLDWAALNQLLEVPR